MIFAQYRIVVHEQCWARDENELRAKLLFLSSLGIAEPVKGLIRRDISSASLDLQKAMQPFIPSLTRNTGTKPQLAEIRHSCKFSLTEPWRKVLVDTGAVMNRDTDPVNINLSTAQLLDMPGETECALLVGGYLDWERDFPTDLYDTFTGPEYQSMPSCPDPQDRDEIWRKDGSSIQALHVDMGEDDGPAALVPVQDTTTGKHYYVRSGEQFGKCHVGIRLPWILEWQRGKRGWALMRVDSETLDNALLDQCTDTDSGMKCTGIPTLVSDAFTQAGDPVDGFAATVPAFIKAFDKKRYDSYLAAVMALDKGTLGTLQGGGIPATWTSDALQTISASDLPLMEKRKRAAWIFSDHAQLAKVLSNDILNKLVEWLPREDWRPILDIFAKTPGPLYLVTYVSEHANEKNRPELACDIQNAHGLVCGEKLESGSGQ